MTDLPSPTHNLSALSAELIAKGRQFYTANYKPREMILDHGKGATVWDLDGNDYVDLGAGRTTKLLSAVGVHTCAILDNDKVKCWGSNNYGQLGLGDFGQRKFPAQVAGSDWTDVRLGYAHACGVRADKTLWCWGSGETGQNGLGTGFAATPTAIVAAQ